MSNRSKRGIAVVSVLLLMMAVLTLGIGALVLSRLNLRISENVRTNSVVRYDTESGIDASMVALEDYYITNLTFPPEGAGNAPPVLLTNLTATTTGPDPSFTVTWYDLISADEASFRVLSTLTNGAEHIAEVLVGIDADASETGSGAPQGLISEGSILINGSSTYIDAGIHGNDGFSITGNVGDDFYVCVDGDGDGEPDRDPITGLCTNTQAVPLADAPITGSPGATTCSPASLCDNGEPITLIDPVVVDPQYYARRNAEIADIAAGIASPVSLIGSFYDADGNAVTDTDGNALQVGCDVEYTTTPTFADLQTQISLLTAPDYAPTICITSPVALSVPDGSTLADVNIIAQGNIDFLGTTTTINSSTLISFAGGIFDDSLTGPGNNIDAAIDSSTIFSEKSIGIHGTNASFTGITTIASAGDVTVNGGAEAVMVNGVATVGLILLAEGDITVNGTSTWYLGAIAGGSFDQNGTSFIFGGVESVDDLTINGGIDIDSGLGYSNDVTDEESTPFVYVVSRR